MRRASSFRARPLRPPRLCWGFPLLCAHSSLRGCAGRLQCGHPPPLHHHHPPSPFPARQCGVRRRPCAAACPVRSSGGGGLDFRAAAAPPLTGRAFKPGVCRPVPSRTGRPRRATPSQFHPLQKAHGGALLSLSRPQTPPLLCLLRPCALPLLQPLGPHRALLPPAACVKAASGLPACGPSAVPLSRRFGRAFLG